MNIIVCGAAKVSESVLEYIHQDNEITVIDENKEKLEMISGKCDVCTIEGDACCPTTLAGAKAENADMVFSALPFDYANLFICHISQIIFGIKRKIAKISNASLIECGGQDKKNILKNFSVDEVIYPELDLANHIHNTVLASGIKSCHAIFDDRFLLVTASIKNINFLTVQESLKKFDAVLLFVLRGGDALDLSALENIEQEDELFFVIKKANLESFATVLKYPDLDRKILIIGGGKIGYHIAKIASRSELKQELTIIEEGEKRAKELAEKLPEANVINSNGINSELLQSLELDSKTAVVSATNDDRVNIFSQLLLKNKDIESSTTIVQDELFKNLAQSLGIKNIICPGSVTSKNFLNLMQLTKHSIIKEYDFYNKKFISFELQLTNEEIIKKVNRIPKDHIERLVCFNGQEIVELHDHDHEFNVGDSILICVSAKFKTSVKSHLY